MMLQEHIHGSISDLGRKMMAGVALAVMPVLMGFVLAPEALLEDYPVPPELSAPLHFYMHTPDGDCHGSVADPLVYGADGDLYCYVGESQPDAQGRHVLSNPAGDKPSELRIRFADLVFATAADFVTDDIPQGLSFLMGVRDVESDIDFLAVFGLECGPHIREDGVLMRLPHGTHCLVDSIGATSALAGAARDGDAIARTILRFMVSQTPPVPVAQADQSDGVGGMHDAEPASLIARARSGDVDAQFELAVAYLNGDGVLQDDDELYRWASLAAGQDHYEAQELLGLTYAYGRGAEVDMERSLYWLQRAAETERASISKARERIETERERLLAERDRLAAGIAAGERWATYFRPVIELIEGMLEKEDYETAAARLAPLAEAGNPASQTMLGFFYRMGTGVERNTARAVELFTAAAEGGYERAYVALCDELAGIPYDPDLPPGLEGVPARELDLANAVAFCARAFAAVPDDLRIGEQYGRVLLVAAHASEVPDFGPALDLIRPAAEAGRATAQFQWGSIAYHGFGIEPDHDEAFTWTERAARAGYPFAITNLGFLYWNGAGTEADQQRAVALWTQAAETGHADALYNLGWVYAHGTPVDQDYVRAAELYRQAADAGNANAMVALGRLYLDGLGVSRDLEEAERMFLMGADNNADNAQAGLAALEEVRNQSSAPVLYTRTLERIHAGEIDSHFLMPLETPEAFALGFGFFDALLSHCEPASERSAALPESRRFTHEMYNSFTVFYGSQVRGTRFGPATSSLNAARLLEADILNAARTMNDARQAAAPHAEVLVDWALGRFGSCGSEGYNKLVAQLASATMFGTIDPAADTAGPVLVEQEPMDNGMLMLCVYDDDLATRAAYRQIYKTYHAVNIGMAALPIIADPTFLRDSCPATPDPAFALESHTRKLVPASSEGIAGETLAERRANYFIERLLPDLPAGLSRDPELTERFRPILAAIESIEVPRPEVSSSSGSFVQREFRTKLGRYIALHDDDPNDEFGLLLTYYDIYRDRILNKLP